MTSKLYLESIPIVDDHCHAGVARTIRQHKELNARGFIEGRIRPAEWRQYNEAVHNINADSTEALDLRLRVGDMMERAVEMRSGTVYSRAVEIGCVDLYGEWDDQERLEELSTKARKEGVPSLYEKAMDRVNCPVVLTDTPRVDRSIWSEKRFKWIARLDPFLYPFGPGDLSKRPTEVANFHRRFAKKLAIALHEQGLNSPPNNFADYISFVEQVVESFMARGAVALKFVSAYVRSLEFRPVAETEAIRVFRDLSRGKMDESRLFEDYMARRLLLWAAEHDVPVQVHPGLGHPVRGMDFEDNNPLKLQSVLMDERFSNLRLIILHGAYPFCREATVLAYTHGNVYLDFSRMCCLNYNSLIAQLVDWLEILPADKLLWGTDTGLPETQLGATVLSRQAIASAVNRGVKAGIWSARQAHWLAERVCFRNVCDLYGFSL